MRYQKEPADPSQVRKLLGNQDALRQVLSDPAAKKLLVSLQGKDRSKLQNAAQSALNGDTSALSGILQDLSRDPEASRALQHLDGSTKGL